MNSTRCGLSAVAEPTIVGEDRRKKSREDYGEQAMEEMKRRLRRGLNRTAGRRRLTTRTRWILRP